MQVLITPPQLQYLKFLEAHHIQEEPKMYLTQNQAFKRFGRANVERWAKQGKVKRYLRPSTIEYKMSDLLIAAETQSDVELY